MFCLGIVHLLCQRHPRPEDVGNSIWLSVSAGLASHHISSLTSWRKSSHLHRSCLGKDGELVRSRVWCCFLRMGRDDNISCYHRMHIWTQLRSTKKYTEYSVSIAKNKNNNILAFPHCIHTPVRGSITYHRYSSLQPICQKPAARWPVDSSLALLICPHRDALFHKKNRIDAVFFSPSRNSIRALAGICRPITGLKCFCLKKLREGNGCPYHHCCDGMIWECSLLLLISALFLQFLPLAGLQIMILHWNSSLSVLLMLWRTTINVSWIRINTSLLFDNPRKFRRTKSNFTMGRLIKNHWARLIVLTAAACMSP